MSFLVLAPDGGRIVATKEGGAITGEERLREHTDQLYGAILSYEGKPGDYQITYIATLRRELDDVKKEFENVLAKDLPGAGRGAMDRSLPWFRAACLQALRNLLSSR